MPTASLDPHPPGPSHQVFEQAAQWFAVLSSGEASAAEQQRWEGWLAESPEHRQAWEYVERISQRFVPIQSSPDKRSAITAYDKAQRQRNTRRQTLLGLAALAGSGLLGWATWRHTPLPDMTLAWLADHHTGTGEVREITLADGTRVWLNALSAFNQDYQPGQRLLHLVRGEILIETAAEATTDTPGRPFYIHTAHGRLQALGTRFTVRLDDAQTFVAVYDGAVEVRTGTSGAHATLAAGQQTRFSADALAAIETADPAREAWTQGLLVARDMPLADVVRELRRHHHGHLGLAPEVADLRVFGGYPVGNPEQTLTMLQTVLPIRVRRTLPWWISIEPR